MNILFLAHRIPFPPNKGDKIRSFNMIRHLSQTHHVYLGTILDEKPDAEYLKKLKVYCKDIFADYFHKKTNLLLNVFEKKPFSVANFYSAALQNYVDRILRSKKIDVIICFSSSMAEYVFRNPLFKQNKLNHIKLIMDYIDLDSDKWLQYSRFTQFPLNLIYSEEQRRLFEYEKKINQTFHNSIFVSHREADLFKRIFPQAKNVSVIPNGVDTDFFQARPKSPGTHPPNLLFTGVMDYFANYDGVKWFCKQIFGKIKKEFPQVRFYIVGMRPLLRVKRLARIDGVHVTGYVEDIREYYWNADVCVIPLRIAKGLQNKLLEAMATGNAVVATSNAWNGIICKEDEDILLADSASRFSEQVIRLLNNKTRRQQIAQNAVRTIQEFYSWDKNLKELDRLL